MLKNGTVITINENLVDGENDIVHAMLRYAGKKAVIVRSFYGVSGPVYCINIDGRETAWSWAEDTMFTVETDKLTPQQFYSEVLMKGN